MPLHITPGYKCPFCKCVVHKEMDKEYHPIFCPYCDIPMKRRHFDKKYKKSPDETMEVSKLDDVVMSECSSDCLKEDTHFSDIEENCPDYIVLTDSDDEQENSMQEVCSKIKNIALASVGDTDSLLASNIGHMDAKLPNQNRKNNDAVSEDDFEELDTINEVDEDGEVDCDEDYDGND